MKRIIIVLTLLFFTSRLVHAQAGYLDKTFGNGGVVNIKFGKQDFSPLDMKILPEGKVLHCGWLEGEGEGKRIYLMRHDSLGVIDSTFGVNGYCTLLLVYGYHIAKLYVCDDGKILVYGDQDAPNQIHEEIPSIIRFLPDGGLDSSFAVNGIYTDPNFPGGDYFDNIMVDTSGNIIALGAVSTPNSTYYTYRPTITRFTPDGKRDTAFGDDGFKIAGSVSDTGYISDAVFSRYDRCVFTFEVPNTTGAGIKMLCTDLYGVSDTTFGDSGVLRIQISDDYEYISSIAVDNIGQLLCNVHIRSGQDYKVVLTRILQDGSIDQSFGGLGVSQPRYPVADFSIYLCASDSSQNIIQVGGLLDSLDSDHIMASRYYYNGNIDSSYGVLGIANSIPQKVSEVRSIAVQQDGKYLFLGYNPYYSAASRYAIICRVNNISTLNVQHPSLPLPSLSLHPTPSTDNCTVTYTLLTSGECTMTLRDESGREVRTFGTSEYRIAGEHKEEPDLRGLSAGVYFLQIESNGTIQTVKLIKQ